MEKVIQGITVNLTEEQLALAVRWGRQITNQYRGDRRERMDDYALFRLFQDLLAQTRPIIVRIEE